MPNSDKQKKSMNQDEISWEQKKTTCCTPNTEVQRWLWGKHSHNSHFFFLWVETKIGVCGISEIGVTCFPQEKENDNQHEGPLLLLVLCRNNWQSEVRNIAGEAQKQSIYREGRQRWRGDFVLTLPWGRSQFPEMMGLFWMKMKTNLTKLTMKEYLISSLLNSTDWNGFFRVFKSPIMKK